MKRVCVRHALFYGAGVRFQVTAREEETASWLCDCLLPHAARTDGMFTTMHLVPEEIPEWRSEELTLRKPMPRNWAPGCPRPPRRGYALAPPTGSWARTGLAAPELDPGLRLRGCDRLPFPAHASIPAPDLDPDQISDEALEEWGSYVDDDAGDTPGWRYPLLYPALPPGGREHHCRRLAHQGPSPE